MPIATSMSIFRKKKRKITLRIITYGLYLDLLLNIEFIFLHKNENLHKMLKLTHVSINCNSKDDLQTVMLHIETFLPACEQLLS